MLKPLIPLPSNISPIALEFLESPEGSLLRADLIAWGNWRQFDVSTREARATAFEWNMLRIPEWRTLFDYRAEKGGMPYCRDVSSLLPRGGDLYISATPEIGPGFRIQHGNATWVNAERIGKNFFVNQNVTIGFDRGRPTIGDYVAIRAGAIVVGPITIGDHAVIAPNAYVNFDVPAGAVVRPQRSLIKLRDGTEAFKPESSKGHT